ncbi:MAG: hypothetical protein FD166_1383 [Bacteroidetes bacterium]|nr:MAG: hypothetical protein FD166_1383 [Bacteroidota bacterium]
MKFDASLKERKKEDNTIFLILKVKLNCLFMVKQMI